MEWATSAHLRVAELGMRGAVLIWLSELYRSDTAEMGDVKPDGLISHLIVKHDDGLRPYGVWQSRAEWVQYRDGVVRSAVARVLSRVGIPEPPLPEEHQLDVVAVQTS